MSIHHEHDAEMEATIYRVRKIEHRPFTLPPKSLCSTTETHRKFERGHCRMCLRPGKVRPLTKHHLVPVAWFRKQPLALKLIRNAHANIVPLCRLCHDLVDSRDPAERAEARRHLRRSLTQAEISFAVVVLGLPWLNKEYPRE
jgi:hypothetical protein